MDFLTSDTFVTIFSVVGSAIGLFLAVRADIAKRIDRVEKRIDRVDHRTDRVEQSLGQRIDDAEQRLGQRIDDVEQRLGQRIDDVEQGLGKRIDRVEQGLGKRIDRVEQGLGKRIDDVEQGLGKRIDRVEEQARADHKEVVAEIGELKTAVSVVSAKLDERSSPRRLVIQEPPADYPVDDESEGDPETR